MAPRGSLLLLALLLLSCALPRGRGQHWSHGWYPGGKRDLGTPTNLQVGCPPRVTPLQVIPFPPGVIPPLPRVMPTPAVSPWGPGGIPKAGTDRLPPAPLPQRPALRP
uniref:Progonadoliberin n=1 Tax=Corvus moneduloides TaxID=1196302 RepID=A0A8C3DZN9_CORMO